VKLEWREAYPRDPELARQFELEVLPALSTANVRDLLQAALPLPQLTPERARDLADYQKTRGAFNRRVKALRAKHQSRAALMKRFDKAGLA